MMRNILIAIALFATSCAPYHAADPTRPPIESAYAADVSCELSDPAYIAAGAGSGGLLGSVQNIANHQAAGYTMDEFVNSCMRAKGFNPDR